MKIQLSNVKKMPPLDKKNFSEIILGNLVDLKDNYIKDYGPTDRWTDIQKNIFLLNADLMIERTAEKFKVPVSQKAKMEGLSRGVCQVQLSVSKKHTNRHSVNEICELELNDRLDMDDDLTNSIYLFITKGISDQS